MDLDAILWAFLGDDLDLVFPMAPAVPADMALTIRPGKWS